MCLTSMLFASSAKIRPARPWTARKAKLAEPKNRRGHRSRYWEPIPGHQAASNARLYALTVPMPVAMSQPGVAPNEG